MYHPPSSNRQIAKRFFIYGVMSLAVVSLVTLLILLMLGYRLNQTDGNLVQGGLMQFASKPNGSRVTIDGESFGSRTPSKKTVSPGEHTFVYNQEGYRPWQKTLNINAGSVTWLNYARLIPEDTEPVKVGEFDTLAGALASPSGRRFAFTVDSSTPSFIIADLQRDSPTYETIDLPGASYTEPDEGQSGSFKLMSWDSDERYLIVRYVYNKDKKVEWIVVDRENAENAKNMTRLIDIPADKVEFAGRGGRTLFVKSNNDVRKVDLAEATLSRPLVSNAADFTMYSDEILTYVTRPNESGSREVGYYREGRDNSQAIRNFDSTMSDSLLISMGEYYDETYVAIAHGAVVEIYRGRLPVPEAISSLNLVSTMNLAGKATELDIRGGGRFVFARYGSMFATYDLERDELHQSTLEGDNSSSARVDWLDQFMVWSDSGSQLSFYDFDGANRQLIVDVEPGFDVTLNPNGRFVYSIGQDDNGYYLQQVRLQLP